MNRRRFFPLLALLGLAPRRSAAGNAPPAVPARGEMERFVLQRSPVRGFCHRQTAEFLARLQPGAALTLRAEPENPHDPHAVMVFWKEHLLGYLPRENNAHASRLLSQGLPLEAKLLSVEPDRYEWEPLRIEVAFTMTVAGAISNPSAAQLELT